MDSCNSFVCTGPLYDAVTVPASHSDRSPAGEARRVIARVFALTDVGRTREHNEDTFLVADLESGLPLAFTYTEQEIEADAHGLLFLVADGMGGAASGELASSMAGSMVLESLKSTWSQSSPSVDTFAESLRDATTGANTRIHQYARDNPEHRGMGTTATIAGLLGDRLFLAQVGDSRAYLVRDRRVTQLTKDQSLMQRLVEAGELTEEEAEVSERRNIILQALGPESHVTIDLTHQQLRRGDTLILCSDGLSGLVRADEIARTAREETDLRQVCRRLVERANTLGGPDNITVVAARFDGPALEPHTEEDPMGYAAYPLAGTLNDGNREEIAPRGSRARGLKSDPTPRFGTPIPSAAALEDAFARARDAETAEILGAPEPVVKARKRAVQPIYLMLLLVAAVAIVWGVSRVIALR